MFWRMQLSILNPQDLINIITRSERYESTKTATAIAVKLPHRLID